MAKVTQKEKIIRATMMAQQIKSIASRIEYDMRDYDCSWTKHYIDDLCRAADEFLKLK